ncbi:MAG: DNA repair protein Rad50, partial [Deltaproteobacteria bacterium]|nr:DNA repair protein Rad50 [Deltaproteobacteria bacterium]
NSARARYESEKQPKVIQEAGRFLKTFTSGRYPFIAAPFGEKRVEVVMKDRRRKEIAALSRGTAEQLYLSLRFGFIETFANKSEALPVIMDEILVNFDPIRAREAAEAMMELSRRHQILFFTCHPWIVDIFKEVAADVPVLKISEGRVESLKV